MPKAQPFSNLKTRSAAPLPTAGNGRRDFLSGPDYDHVTGSDSEDDDETGEPRGTTDFEDEFDAPFNPHLNLKDFDALILDLERELSKQINVCL